MTSDLLLALEKRFPAPEYAFFREVRNGTGYSRGVTRTADAMAFGLWPSRGLELIGFEVKTYRGDWLREKQSPEKAEEICRFCDRWYVVASNGVVKREELPPTWGLLEMRGERLTEVVAAPVLNPEKLDRLMVASLLRCGAQQAAVAEAERVRKLVDEAIPKDHRFIEQKAKAAQAEQHLAEFKHAVDEFEKKSGVQITRWGDNGRIGEAVNLYLRGDLKVEQHADRLKRLKAEVEGIARNIDRALTLSERARG